MSAGRNKPRDSRPPEPACDEVLTWAEVSRTHRVRNGVYQRGGRLVSLLTDFGRINPCYPDRFAEGDPDRVIYTGAGRHGDQHLTPANRALLAAIESGHAVPLFNKLGTGRWQHTGLWRVTHAEHRFDEREGRMLWRFTLRRVQSPKFKVQSSKSEVESSGRAGSKDESFGRGRASKGRV